ncbi:hypothetical protein [uncultured Desulfobacter sp.]|uniref:hypothetical protein n=1 Tax=uncultured Desulfobacter sp. TaxID=240139 RepID=UPI002AA5F3CC|nr:hypothetical protein [uncultured Desulfobacter sp.]
MIMTTKDVSAAFGIDARTVRRWHKAGMRQVSPGKYQAKDAVAFYSECIYARETDSEAIKAAKIGYWINRARREAIAADLAEGIRMPINEVKRAWVWRANEMSNGLGSLTLRAAPLLANKPLDEVSAILDEHMAEICDKYARPGRYTPAPDEGTNG